MARCVAWASLIALAFVSASCGGLDDPGDGPNTSSSPPVENGQATTPTTGPPALQVTCTNEGVQIPTPVVRARTDGVHLSIENLTDERVQISIRHDRGGGGDGADPGRSELVWPIPVGEASIGCQSVEEDAGGDEGYVPFQVVDPDRVWVSTRMDCTASVMSDADYDLDAEGDPRDPVAIARDELREFIEPGDAVEPAGYPDVEPKLVRIVHDGDVVLLAEYTRFGDGWLRTTTERCTDPPA